MNNVARKLYKSLMHYGFDAHRFLNSTGLKNNGWIDADLKELKRQKGDDTTFVFGKPYPIWQDKNDEGGVMKGHYFHQDLYVAREIHDHKPIKHLDIGSRTDGFVAHVAAYREIEIIDFRDITSNVKNIIFRQADLMQLPEDIINYCDSISSLHAIEHFGLGRYGDPIDYFGYLKAIENISKILTKGGRFYFSVPMGTQRIEFNAHRVFSLSYLLEILSPLYHINSFSYVDDAGDFFEKVELNTDNIVSNFGCEFGCAIFVCEKK